MGLLQHLVAIIAEGMDFVVAAVAITVTKHLERR